MTDRYSGLRLGLVGAWCPSLGGDGALVRDRSGRGYHASPSGTSYVAMPGGVTASLPGGTPTSTNSTTAAATVVGLTMASLSAWLWKSSSAHVLGMGFAVGRSDLAGNNRFSFIWWSDGNTYCQFTNVTSHGAAVPSTTGWLHIAMTYDGNQANASRVQLYFNGRPASTTAFGTAPTSLGSSLGTLYLGRDSSERVCQGRVDDARVYSRVLTRPEIALLASQRGIGLVPTRHRRASALSQFWLRQSGAWSRATPWINVGGTWKRATPKIRVGGVWKG